MCNVYVSVQLNPEGAAVRDAEVGIDTGQPAWQAEISGEMGPSARTDRKGEFLLEGLAPGEVSLIANAQGFAQGKSVALDLKPGGTAQDVELRLSRGGTLTGLVLDEEGEPAGGRTISVTNMRSMDYLYVIETPLQ